MKEEVRNRRSSSDDSGYLPNTFSLEDAFSIERELERGVWRLRFSPPVEEAFINYYLNRYMWRIRLGILFGIMLYAVFGLLDLVVSPEHKKIMWTIRYGVVCPSGLLFLLSTYRIRKEWLIHTLHALVIVIAGMGVIAMIAFLPPDKDFLHQSGLMIITFYAYTLSALRFRYALFASLTLVLLHLVGDLFFLHKAVNRMVADMFFLSSANLIGIPVSYLWEYQSRRDFLLTVLLTMEKKRVEKLNEKLREMSYMDSLTGVANRRKFEEYLEAEWERAKRAGRPISLLLIDIDFFKKYNDIMGHPKGDKCLREVAQAISANLRKGIDLVARYGGEEFVVVLPETDLSQAKKIAERIREAVMDLKIPHPGSDVYDRVTVSVGVASLIPREGMRKEQLIKMADEALYIAKKRGRNRVGTFTERSVA